MLIMANFDIVIIGAGPGGIFSAFELAKNNSDLNIAVFEAGNSLDKRKCPIDGDKVKSCIGCKTCAIMSGFGGAVAFSDGKYNITNDFGGTLYEYIGKKKAIDLMKYVDEINMEYGGDACKLYSTAGSKFKKLCMQNQLNLLESSVRHLGTDINYIVLENIYNELKDKVSKEANTVTAEMPAAMNAADGDSRNDAIAALMVLGYSASEINGVLRRMDVSGMSTEQIVKIALKNLI